MGDCDAVRHQRSGGVRDGRGAGDGAAATIERRGIVVGHVSRHPCRACLPGIAAVHRCRASLPGILAGHRCPESLRKSVLAPYVSGPDHQGVARADATAAADRSVASLRGARTWRCRRIHPFGQELVDHGVDDDTRAEREDVGYDRQCLSDRARVALPRITWATTSLIAIPPLPIQCAAATSQCCRNSRHTACCRTSQPAKRTWPTRSFR